MVIFFIYILGIFTDIGFGLENKQQSLILDYF